MRGGERGKEVKERGEGVKATVNYLSITDTLRTMCT